MRTAKQNNPSIKKDDNYSTLEPAFDLLFKYIDIHDKTIWSPFWNEGLISTYSFTPIHKNVDFFTFDPEFDYIIDNPPYTIKQKIFERCIELDRPFALLVPIDTMERQYISKLFKDKDFTIIIPQKRFNFIKKETKVTVPFKTCWFCYGFGLDKQIIFD
tara:strand:+ start:497 stop:973 length:477 start_codon:yes stop_codon:yes gene_type:complete